MQVTLRRQDWSLLQHQGAEGHGAGLTQGLEGLDGVPVAPTAPERGAGLRWALWQQA